MELSTSKQIIAVFMTSVALIEILRRRFFFVEASTKKDWILDFVCPVAVPFLVASNVFILSQSLCGWLLPAHKGALAHWPWWAMFAALLICDDLTQYAWHRLSHTSWLYPLHRAHHSATYLSIRVVYRNNLIYYALMPGLWLSGVLMYLGMMEVYVIYIILKMAVITGAHSSVPWDEPLYRWRWSRPLMWVLERVISTPATHSAHHGLNAEDGVTHYKGNFGNFLFLWDVIFGTAKITRKRPEAFGIEDYPDANWFQELIWPFESKSDERGSEEFGTGESPASVDVRGHL